MKEKLQSWIKSYQACIDMCQDTMEKTRCAEEFQDAASRSHAYASMVTTWEALSDIMDRLDRLEEKIDKLQGGKDADDRNSMPLDAEAIKKIMSAVPITLMEDGNLV